MQNIQPTVFIGSSTESKDVAHAIKAHLKPELNVFVWDDAIFELSEDTLSTLLKFVSIFDFSIFILSDDDLVKSRGIRGAAPRDNTILELGFFMGASGRRRAFPVIAPTKKNKKIKSPSDLLGNTELRLPPRQKNQSLDNWVQKTAERLKNTILERNEESQLQLLPSTGLAVGYYHNFIKPVCEALSQMESIEVHGQGVNLKNDGYDLNIILPATLADASSGGANKYTKDRKLSSITIKTSSRPRPLFSHTVAPEEKLQLFDYPTTLSASHQAIDLILQNGTIGNSKHHELLGDKEIRNFQKTIEHLLQQPEAAEYRNHIKIHRL